MKTHLQHINHVKQLSRSFSILAFFFAIMIFASAISYAQLCVSGKDSCGGVTTFCGPYTLSKGIYRIPFADGNNISITNDHMNHCPRGRLDISGPSGCTIVAAADGWIRRLQDGFTCKSNTGCSCGSVTVCPNNYVWIEHPNGEWTKYTHMATGSVVAAGRFINEYVTAGTSLGIMGQVGCATGPHLHFEVAQLVDTNTLVICSTAGGWFDGDFASNVVPVICGIPGNIFVEGGNYTAGPCDDDCIGGAGYLLGSLSFPNSLVEIVDDNVVFESYTINDQASAMIEAGNYIEFSPGFRAVIGSSVVAQIGDCNQFVEKNAEVNENIFIGENTSGLLNVSVFPNPVSSHSIIEIGLTESRSVEMILCDVLGRIIHVFPAQVLSKGKFIYTIPVEKMGSGTYALRVRCGEINKEVLLVKQ